MQQPIDWHFDARGQKLKYFSIDSEKLARYEADIDYNINKAGFRMDIEMDDVEQGCDIYIGDSTTFALGVRQEEGWAYNHNTKDQFVNLSQVGGSLCTVTRMLGYWVPKLNPENVFLLDPAPNRQEFLREDGVAWNSAVWHQMAYQRMGGHEITEETHFKEKLFLEYVSLEPQIKATRLRNLAAIQWICRDTNLEYADHPPWDWMGGSRDGYHAGTEAQEKILDWFVGVKVSPPLPSIW